jgi:hypothetical protein
MIKCFVDLAGKRRIGTIVKSNIKTVWVKIMIGARTYIIIKRHRIKNKVWQEGDIYAVIHTEVRD